MKKLKLMGGSQAKRLILMARVTGLEPATSGVTGRHSNRLSYTRAFNVRFGSAPRRVVVGAELCGSRSGVKRS